MLNMGKQPKKKQSMQKLPQWVLQEVDDKNMNKFMFSYTLISKTNGDRDKFSVNSYETPLSSKGGDMCTNETLNEELT